MTPLGLSKLIRDIKRIPISLGSSNKKPINSEKVAKAMIKIANENLKKTILESDEIVEISSG